MLDFKKLSNDQLISNLEKHFEFERKNSHTILLYLKEIFVRRSFAERGFSSLFDMLIKHFKLSESSANQRLAALHLLTEVPQAEESFKNGEVNLTTLALAQRQIRREEKVLGKRISKEKKIEIVERISNKTQALAEKELMVILPAAASLPETRERRVSSDSVQVSLTLPDRVRDKLMMLKDRWAHVDPRMDYVQLIERAADLALEKTDRTLKGERASKSKRRSNSNPNLKSNRNSASAGTPKSDVILNPDQISKSDRLTKSEQISKSNLDSNPIHASTPEHRATESVAHISISRTKPAKRLKYYSVKLDKILWSRSGSQCEFIDHETGRRCSSHFKLQRDHITPLAKGGSNDISNLRLLCQTHNLLSARKHFGSASP